MTQGRRSVLAALAALSLLSACNNDYGPPVEGQPITPGQQRYLDNKRYQEWTEDRMQT